MKSEASASSAGPPSKPRQCTPFNDEQTANYDPDAGPPKSRDQRYEDHNQDMEGTWVGPVKIDEWFSKWIPDIHVVDENIFMNIPTSGHVEAAFIEAINKAGICNNLFPRDSHSKFGIDPTTKEVVLPDLTFLSEDLPFDSEHSAERQERAPGLCEMFFDFKFGRQGKQKSDSSDSERGDSAEREDEKKQGAEGDPFAYLSDEFYHCTKDSEDSSLSRGQLVSYANLLSNTGHRLHCFAAVIMRDWARLIRFDRSGAIYTECFNWRNTNILATFISSVDKMTLEQRGWDPSVERLAKDSPEVAEAWDIVNRVAKSVLPHTLSVRDVIPDPANEMRSLCLIHVYDESTVEVHRLVVGNPCSYSYSYVGRGTRGFLAVDLDAKKIVYLKDTWRLSFDEMLKESETYETLYEHDVPHLPGYMMGGDVPINWQAAIDLDSTEPLRFQHSKTWSALNKAMQERAQSNRKGGSDDMISVEPHTHHRIVLEKIGMPLKDYQSSKQLVRVLRDALQSHDRAATAAEILHRDLSNRNIMIDKHGRGMLIDWDMAANYSNRESSVQRRKSRTGTFRFMSTNILENKIDHIHSAWDDMESLIHVLFYTILTTRPLPPEKSAHYSMWKDSIHEVWNPTGAKAVSRLGFITGSPYYTSIVLESYLQPEVLAQLMIELRAAFGPLYHDELLVARSQAIKEEKENARQKLKNGAHILAIFGKYLDSPEFCDMWPSNDAAQKIPGLLPFPRDPERRLVATVVTGTKRKSDAVTKYSQGPGHLVYAKVSKVKDKHTAPEARRDMMEHGKDRKSAREEKKRIEEKARQESAHTARGVSAGEQREEEMPIEPEGADQVDQDIKGARIGERPAEFAEEKKPKGRGAGAKRKGRSAGTKPKGRTVDTRSKNGDASQTKSRSTAKLADGAKAGEQAKVKKVASRQKKDYGKLRMNLRSRPADPPSSETRM